MKARIISYMGEGEALQRKRLAWHNQQLDWLLERGLEIVVFDQGYRENWYRADPAITYARYKGPLLRPGPARNPLLEDFYASGETWTVMADNDAILLDQMLVHFDSVALDIAPYGAGGAAHQLRCPLHGQPD